MRVSASSATAVLTALLGSLATHHITPPTYMQIGQHQKACMRYNTTGPLGCSEANMALLHVDSLQKQLAEARAEITKLERRLAANAGPWRRMYLALITQRRAETLFQYAAWSALLVLPLLLWTLRPSWPRSTIKRPTEAMTTATWSLDGLPPTDMSHARSLAGQLIADATRGRADRIASTLDPLDSEQSAVLLAAADLANGHTALMQAAKHGHVECCSLLLARGAHPLAMDRQHLTASELAVNAGHSDVVGLLSAKVLTTSTEGAKGVSSVWTAACWVASRWVADRIGAIAGHKSMMK